MSEKLFCHTCDESVDYYVEEVDFEYKAKDLSIPIHGKIAFCSKCSSELFHPIYDQENQERAFEIYRDKKGIITPEEIISIRKKYNLGQKDFSKLLGFGEITITRYENGSLPTSAQNQTVKASADPEKMLDFLEQNKDKVDEAVANQLKATLQGFCSKSNGETLIINQIRSIFTNPPNEYTGFKKFSFEKFSQMVLFFADKEKPYKTKLNKLMFYSDFYCYNKFQKSISGSRYICHNFGPVPEKYDTLFENVSSVEWEIDAFGQFAVPVDEFNPKTFDPEELFILETVQKKFKEFNSQQISDFSHEESAWQKTPHYQFIPYLYAKEMSI
ncbi:DUF4065 domain-containing protein [Fodinisporobacter ferrooxydans]|uniref:DUF4065 domain-containing protein n=1 Tax=Fodinisporobacter ferrooxydans TaxID=2901836 RepID=A0ABY4CJP6_9BACL|nr:DUF4065 domain-containing protein [Alicyclobacillaceae bacterium MYW30-H2]